MKATTQQPKTKRRRAAVTPAIAVPITGPNKRFAHEKAVQDSDLPGMTKLVVTAADTLANNKTGFLKTTSTILASRFSIDRKTVDTHLRIAETTGYYLCTDRGHAGRWTVRRLATPLGLSGEEIPDRGEEMGTIKSSRPQGSEEDGSPPAARAAVALAWLTELVQLLGAGFSKCDNLEDVLPSAERALDRWTPEQVRDHHRRNKGQKRPKMPALYLAALLDRLPERPTEKAKPPPAAPDDEIDDEISVEEQAEWDRRYAEDLEQERRETVRRARREERAAKRRDELRADIDMIDAYFVNAPRAHDDLKAWIKEHDIPDALEGMDANALWEVKLRFDAAAKAGAEEAHVNACFEACREIPLVEGHTPVPYRMPSGPPPT